MQRACAILSSVAWPTLYNIFPHYSTNGTIFEGKKNIFEHKMCVLIFPTAFVSNISHLKKNRERYDPKMYIGLHTKNPLFFPVLKKFEFSRQIFEKHQNTKFHEHPSSGSRRVPYVQTDRRRS
jgi:hypothetical protein